MNYEAEGYGYDPESFGSGFSSYGDGPSEPVPVDRSNALGIVRSDIWRNGTPEQRLASVDLAFTRIVETAEEAKDRKVDFGGKEISLFDPSGGWSMMGKEWLTQQHQFLGAAAMDESGGVEWNVFSEDFEVPEHLVSLLDRQKKERGPLDGVGNYVNELRAMDTDEKSVGPTFEGYVDWYNSNVKTEAAKIDPSNKSLKKQFYGLAQEANFDPSSLGDLVGVIVNGKLAINPEKYSEIDQVESFINNHKKLTPAEKKLALIDYRKKVENAIGQMVSNFAQADAGILMSYFSSPLNDDFIKAAENPNFSGYEFLKANKERFQKDDSVTNEVVETLKNALMATGTGALFLSGKLAGAMGAEGVEKALIKPAEVHGWLAEQRMKGFDNQGTAFSIGTIDFTRRDLTELVGQVGSFLVMGGLGTLGVKVLTKMGLLAGKASDGLVVMAARTAAKSSDDVAKLATTNVLETAKRLGVKGVDVVKAAGLDATAYAAGMQASGMSFGRTHAQVIEQTGDDDEAFREASIQGVSDGLSAFIATSIMNRFGLGAEAIFGGKGPRAGGGIVQNIRSRTLNSESRKAVQESLKKLAGGDKKLFRQMSKDMVSSVNSRASAMGLRGWGVAGGTVSEGIEESMDEVISTAIQAMYHDSENWTDEFWGNIHDNWQQYVKAGVLGAIGGSLGASKDAVLSPIKTFSSTNNAQKALSAFHERTAKGLDAFEKNQDAVVFDGKAQKFAEFLANDSISVKDKSQTIIDEAERRFVGMSAVIAPEGATEAKKASEEASKVASGTEAATAPANAATAASETNKGQAAKSRLSTLKVGGDNVDWNDDVEVEEGSVQAVGKDIRYVLMNLKGGEAKGDVPAFVKKVDAAGNETDLSFEAAQAELAAMPKGKKFGKHPNSALLKTVESQIKLQKSKDQYVQWKKQVATGNGNRGQESASGEEDSRAGGEAKGAGNSSASGSSKPKSPRQPATGSSATATKLTPIQQAKQEVDETDDVEKLKALAETKEPAGSVFKTAQGSVYTVNEDGSTTRLASSNRPTGSTSDSGQQPKSTSTVFLTKEQLDSMSIIQAKSPYSMEIRKMSDGRHAVFYTSGPNAGKAIPDTVVTGKSAPEVGLYPLELFEGGKYHPGNKIVSIESQPAAPVAQPNETDENQNKDKEQRHEVEGQVLSDDASPEKSEEAASANEARSERRLLERVFEEGESQGIDHLEPDDVEVYDERPEARDTFGKDGKPIPAYQGNSDNDVWVDRKGVVGIRRGYLEETSPEQIQDKVRDVISGTTAQLNYGVHHAAEVADSKEDTPASIVSTVDESTVVVSPDVLPGGAKSGSPDSSGGTWDQVKVGAGVETGSKEEGVTYYTYTPAPGMELTMAPGDVVLIGGDKSKVLVFEDSFNNLGKRKENRPADRQGVVHSKGIKTQGAYRFRLVDLSLGLDGPNANTAGMSDTLRNRLNGINNRFWRSTLHTVSDTFSDNVPSLVNGSISDKDVSKLFDQVASIIMPKLAKNRIVKEALDGDASNYLHYSKADGKIHVDIKKLKSQLIARYGASLRLDPKDKNSKLAQKLMAMDVAQMMGHLVNEEGIHLVTADIFSNNYLKNFYEELASQKLGGEFFRNTMKQIAFKRKKSLFPTAEASGKWQDVNLGLVKNKKDKIDLSMELVRAGYQLMTTGTTTEQHASEVRDLMAAMREDMKDKAPVSGFVKTLAEMIKRYAKRISMVLMMRYHQGNLPDGYQDILSKINTAYTEAGMQGDTEMIRRGAAERSEERAEFTYRRMMDEIGYIASAQHEALAKLRNIPSKTYFNASMKLEDVLTVDFDTMQLHLRDSVRTLIEDNEGGEGLAEIDAVLDELNNAELQGNTSFGKAMLHASILREAADMRLAALDFDPTSIFSFDTRSIDKPDDARLRIMAEIMAGAKLSNDPYTTKTLGLEKRVAETEARIESARSLLFGSLLNETHQLDINTPSGRRRLMQIARGVIGINSRGGKLYQAFSGEQSDDAIRDSLENIREQIIQSVTIEQAASKLRDVGVPVPLFASKRKRTGDFKAEPLLVPTKMETLQKLEDEHARLRSMVQFFSLKQDQDQASVRSRAERLERLADTLDETDPRGAETARLQTQITRAELGVDKALASRRYNDFRDYIRANNDYNQAIEHVIQTAIGQSYKDPTGYGMSMTDVSTGAAQSEVTKLPNVAGNMPANKAFGHDVLSRADKRVVTSMDYASKSVEGTYEVEPDPSLVKERENYRSVIESNAAFLGREHYRTAMRDFMSGYINEGDDFMVYFNTAGLNLATIVEEDSQRVRYEPWERIFRKMPGFSQIYSLKNEMIKIANGNVKYLAEGRTPEVVARELVDWINRGRRWLGDIERVTTGVTERIGAEATLGARISLYFNGKFDPRNEASGSILSEAKGQLDAFDKLVFELLSQSGGFVGRNHQTGLMSISKTGDASNLGTPLSRIADMLQGSDFGYGSPFIESLLAAGSAAHISRKALDEFHDGLVGSGKGWRENVRKEIQRTIDDPTYVPSHPDFAQVRESPMDLATFNKLSFALRYFEKSPSYYVGPMWAHETLLKLQGLQMGDGGEPFVAVRAETKRQLKYIITDDQEAFDRAEQGDDPRFFVINEVTGHVFHSYGGVQQRGRLGPDNSPEQSFNQGETSNSVEGWTEQLVAPGFGETESFATPQGRDARNRARIENSRKKAITEALMFLGYHSEGDRAIVQGDRSADNAQRFAQQVMAHAFPRIPASQLVNPLALVRRGIRGAFPALADGKEIDDAVAEFLENNPVYNELEGLRSNPDRSNTNKVINEGRIDPEKFVTDILEFKTGFEREALESARIKEGADIAQAHNALLALATQGKWNRETKKHDIETQTGKDLIEESKAFITGFTQSISLARMSASQIKSERELISESKKNLRKKSESFEKSKAEKLKKLEENLMSLEANPFSDFNEVKKAKKLYDEAASQPHPFADEWGAVMKREARLSRSEQLEADLVAAKSIDDFVKSWKESKEVVNPGISELQAFELVKFVQQAYLHGDGRLPIYDVRSAPWATWGYLSDNPILSHLLDTIPSTRMVDGEPIEVKTIVISPDDYYLSRPYGRALRESGLGLTFLPGTGRLPNVIYAPHGLRSVPQEQVGSLLARTLAYHAEHNPEAEAEVLRLGTKIDEILSSALDVSLALGTPGGITSVLTSQIARDVSENKEIKELLKKANAKAKRDSMDAIERHLRQLSRLAKVLKISWSQAYAHSLYPDSDPRLAESLFLIGQVFSSRELKTFLDYAMVEEVALEDGSLPPHMADGLIAAIQRIGLGSQEGGDIESLNSGPQDFSDRTIYQQADAADDQFETEDEDEAVERNDAQEKLKSMLGLIGDEEGVNETDGGEAVPENNMPSTIGLIRLLRAIVDERDGPITTAEAEALAISDASRFLFNGLASILRTSDFQNWNADSELMDARIGNTRKRSKEHLMDESVLSRRASPIFGHERSFRQSSKKTPVGDAANLVYPRSGTHTPMKSAMDRSRMANTAATIVARIPGVEESIKEQGKEAVEEMRRKEGKTDSPSNYTPPILTITVLDGETIANLDELLPQVPIEVDGEIVMTGSVSARIAEKRKAFKALQEDFMLTGEAIDEIDERLDTMSGSFRWDALGPEAISMLDRESVRGQMADWFLGEARAFLQSSHEPMIKARAIAKNLEVFGRDELLGGQEAAVVASSISTIREIIESRSRGVMTDSTIDTSDSNLNLSVNNLNQVLDGLEVRFATKAARYLEAKGGNGVDKALLNRIGNAFRLPRLKQSPDGFDLRRFSMSMNRRFSTRSLTRSAAEILVGDLASAFGSLAIDSGVDLIGARPGKKFSKADSKKNEAIREQRNKVRRELMGWVFEVAENGQISRETVMSALREGFGMRQAMQDAGEVVSFDFLDALVEASSLSSEDVRKQIQEALSPEYLAEVRQLEARRSELEKHLAKTNYELGLIQDPLTNKPDTRIGAYYHTDKTNGKETKVRADMFFRSPLTVGLMDETGRAILPEKAWETMTPEQRMDWAAVSSGTIEALKEYADQRVDDVYKRLRGHPDNLLDFDPVKLLEKAVRIVDSENAIMKERIGEAKTVAEAAHMRGMTIDATSLIADPAEVETYQRGKSGRMKRYTMPKNYRDRRQHIGRLFNVTGPDGQMVPIVLVSRDAREELIKHFPNITKRNVESKLAGIIHRAAPLVDPAEAGIERSEPPGFFMEYSKAVRNQSFNAGLDLENKLSADTRSAIEGKNNWQVANHFVAKMAKQSIKVIESRMNGADKRNRTMSLAGDVTASTLNQWSEQIRLLAYAWGHEDLTPETKELISKLLVSIDDGSFARNPEKWRLEDILAKAFTDIEGKAILEQMTAGITVINGPTSRLFHNFFHHHDSRLRRRFLRNRASRETARRLMTLLDRGVDGLSGRSAYESAKKNTETKIAKAAKELGYSAKEHTIGYMIAQLKGFDNRFGLSYGDAFTQWYLTIQAGGVQLGQLDSAQQAKFGNGTRRYFQANHLDMMRDVSLAKEMLALIDASEAENVISRFDDAASRIRNEDEFRRVVGGIIKKLEQHSEKGADAVNKYADTIKEVFDDIANAMHIAQFFVSQETKAAKTDKFWKEGGADAFRTSYSSVPVRLGFAADPFADEGKRSKREGSFVQDPADILSFREASFFNGLGRNAGNERSNTVYRPLVINGLSAPIGMVDDALFRLNVTPSYEVARRMVGRAVEDRHGLQTVVGQDSYMMDMANAMNGTWKDKHVSDADSALSTIAHEMETIIKNDTQLGVINTGFAETARFLSGSYIARSLASIEQYWNQSVGPVLGFLAKKAVVGDWQGIHDFLEVYGRQFPSAVQAFYAHHKAGDGEYQPSIFIDAVTMFIRNVDPFVFYRAHEVSDEKSDVMRRQIRTGRGVAKAAVGVAAKNYESFGDRMLSYTIGAPERLLGRAIFLSEVRSELRRRGNSLAEMSIDEMIKRPDMVDPSVGSYARTKVNDMLGQSDQGKKGWLFQSRDSSPVMSTLWKSITRFSNHTASTGANLNTFVPVIWDKQVKSRWTGNDAQYDQDTYREALENVTGTLVQNVLFGILKPKMLVPMLGYMFFMLVGDDDDEAQQKAQDVANKLMTVDEEEGLNFSNVTKALLFGRQKEMFMQSKTADAAQASAFAEILNRSISETVPAIPVLGVVASYYWGQKLSQNLITEPLSQQLASLITGVDTSKTGMFQDDAINIREYQPQALEALAETTAPAAALYDFGSAAATAAKAKQTGEFSMAEIAAYLAAEALPPFRELRSYFQKKFQDEIRLQGLGGN